MAINFITLASAVNTSLEVAPPVMIMMLLFVVGLCTFVLLLLFVLAFWKNSLDASFTRSASSNVEGPSN